MTTSKALRARPPRMTENYVASIKKLFGNPDTIPDAAFLNGRYIVNGRHDTLAVWPSATNEGAYSIDEPIGFAVEINGKTYTRFSVATAGWIFLRDPAGGSTGVDFWTDILNGFTNIYDNNSISATFSYNHLFLPIWFDRNHTVAANPASLSNDDNGYSMTITTGPFSMLDNIIGGTDTRAWPYDAVDCGVRYINSYDSKRGKCLLVRWTVTQRFYKNRLKFELALFENGTIEYRYWPIKTFEPSDYEPALSSATVGAFWSSPALGSYKFRDFAPLLGYQLGQRNMSQLGGATYSAAYTDDSAVYANRISSTFWPANGAIITFAPPVKLVKFLPRKIIGEMAATTPLVSAPGLYDDRKTISYISSSTIHMPSTLPSRLLGDSGDIDVSLRQSLFTDSDCLLSSTHRRMNKSAINSQLTQLNSIETLNKSSNRSFNESQKNYLAIVSPSSFYATGSSIEECGGGFTSPLKSKTQFRFSLPVSKQSTMPSLTSSLYYYNRRLEQWIQPLSANFNNDIKTRTISTFSARESDYVDSYAYRVTETAIAFDAVGRRVVSGTLPSYPTATYQSDAALGGFFNAPESRRIGVYEISSVEKSSNTKSTAINKKYGNSFTDNINFYPNADSTITIPVDYPFLIEKVVVNIPLYITNDWFRDKTTCSKAFGDTGQAAGLMSGAIDFGGPGITFSLLCPRRGVGSTYLDIIASGTITHTADDISSVELYKNTGMNTFALRPVGFRSFSNPTTVISGSNNIFDGVVKLELTPSVAAGLTLARNDISTRLGVADIIASNRQKCIELLTSPVFSTLGGAVFDANDVTSGTLQNYQDRSTRIYLQQVSPLSRGTTGIEFNGNSILGGNIAYFNLKNEVNNPFYSSASGSLSTSLTTKIDSADFTFQAISLYSLVDSRTSPYLVLPGDKLTFAISKTRPVSYKMFGVSSYGAWNYPAYTLTGSHDAVMLNTGSIDITIYGSYVREGVEFNP